jgi:hypothetical protein
MKMGTGKISISSVRQTGDTLYVTGGGFNEWSKIYVNGNRVDTVYVNSDMIIAEKHEIETGDNVTVVQSGDNNLILGETDAYIYK